MGGFFREVFEEIVGDMLRSWYLWLLGLVIIVGFSMIAAHFNPPPKPVYYQVAYSGGVYTTDSVTYEPLGCISFSRYTICGDFVVTQKDGELPNETF